MINMENKKQVIKLANFYSFLFSLSNRDYFNIKEYGSKRIKFYRKINMIRIKIMGIFNN
jgi:hypothetical protein